MLKAVNSHKSSSFQQFKDDIIKELAEKPVIQDLDLIRLAGNQIKYLIEVKRSFNTTWKPYIKSNYPERHFDSLDDFNYRALFCLARRIPAEVVIFYYVKEKLTEHGVKPFKVLDIDLTMQEYSFYSLADIEAYLSGKSHEKSDLLLKRNLSSYKDKRNPNILSSTQNIFAWFSQNEIARQFYYVESDGIWTMLMSNSKTSEPIWIYIELNKDIVGNIPKDIDAYFSPQISIAQAANIPLSIICYDKHLLKFDVYKWMNGIFSHCIMDKIAFIQYYSSYVKMSK